MRVHTGNKLKVVVGQSNYLFAWVYKLHLWVIVAGVVLHCSVTQ